MTPLRTLLGDGDAVVVGLPRHFKLASALSGATSIRVATAFGRKSGWQHLSQPVKASKANVQLLTGLYCNLTEPGLLKEWLQLKLTNARRIRVAIAAEGTFFHPKVLIVHSRYSAFAVVGSGNLSSGGLQSNCECSVFVTDPSHIAQLTSWYDHQFDSGTDLVAAMITKYEPHYKKSKKKADALTEEQENAAKKLKAAGEASLQLWTKAVQSATTYFSSSSFDHRYKLHREAAKRLLKNLNAPDFNFNRAGWDSFYSEGALGKLDERYKAKVFESRNRLKKGLRALLKNPDATIPKLLGRKGEFRIKGFGVNSVSKILAAHDPAEWPVYNSKVAKSLASFGYKSPRVGGSDSKYLAYRSVMHKFMDECRAKGLKHVDGISLDVFFYDHAKQLGE